MPGANDFGYTPTPGRLNQDTMGGMSWEDFILQMMLNAERSNSVLDDFDQTNNPFGGGFTLGRQYTNQGPNQGSSQNFTTGTGLGGPSFGGAGPTGTSSSPGGGSLTGAEPYGPTATGGNLASGTATQGGLMSGMTAKDWASLAGTVYGAWDGYQSNKAANAPWTQSNTPGLGLGGDLSTIASEAARIYQSRLGQQMPDFFGNIKGGGGPSSQNRAMQDQLLQQAMGMTGGSGALNAGMSLMESRLGGGGGFNPYAGSVQDQAQNFSNPYLDMTFGAATGAMGGGLNPYIDQYLGSLGIEGLGTPAAGGSSGGFSGGGGGGGYPGGGGGGGSFTGWDPGLVNPYLKSVLDGKFMDGNPYLQEQIDAAARDIEAHYGEGVIPGVGDQFERAGMIGSSVYGLGLGAADAAYSQNLADAISGMRYQGYETGVGTYMDGLGMLNQLQGQNMAGQYSLAGQQASAGAAYAGQQAAIASQQKMHAQQMALQALGLYSDDARFGLNTMGGMAGLYGDQSMGMLGIAGNMALGRGDQDLGAMSLLPGLEGAHWMGVGNAWDMTQQQAAQQTAAGNANRNAQMQRAQQQQQQWLFNFGLPQANLSDWSNITLPIASQFSTTQGQGPRGNSTQAALGGAVAGAQLGAGLYDIYK